MMWKRVLVLLLSTSVLTENPSPESSMESPLSSIESESSDRGRDHADSTVQTVKRSVGRAKRSLQFDGWYPMDVSNPMSDEPTLRYQPPPLERVHFSDEPVDDKPMYPVKPKNPTVFVVRAEPKEQDVHSVYGTENIEYFHIHPQTNTIKAFRSPAQNVGAIQFVSPPQFGDTRGNPKHFSSAEKDNSHEFESSVRQETPSKVDGFADKADVFDDIRYVDDPSEYDGNQDMDGSFSEYSAIVVRPEGYNRRGYTNIESYHFRPATSPHRYDLIDIHPNRRSDTAQTTRPALYELLGNFKYESQIEETPYLGSATDSARASIFREVPPPNFLLNQASRRHGTQNIPRPGPRGPTYSKIGLDDPSSQPWYLIDTKSERRREPSIASYIHTETRLGDERVHYKPIGPVSYVSKDSERARLRDAFYNSHLDDHMNSYKPSTSLTANSLSELLQIFRYTAVTDKPGKGVTEEPIVREFRYTRPADESPTTVPSFGENFPTNFRYTSTPSSEELSFSKDAVTPAPNNIQYDAVADTNSLDGYLFSDSEASPEYAHPEVKPNIVVIAEKDIGNSKGLTKEKLKENDAPSSNITIKEVKATSFSPENIEPVLGNIEIIYPGPTPETTTLRSSSWPLYIIHEGHSKVKVFGINTTNDKKSVSKMSDVYILSTNDPTTHITETNYPETTPSNSLPTSTPQTISTTQFLVDTNSTSTPSTTSSTTITSSTVSTYDLILPKDSDEEYDYYFYDNVNEYPTGIAYNGEYFSNGWEGSSLRRSGSPVDQEIPLSASSQRSLPDIQVDLKNSQRLPRVEGSSSNVRDRIPLLPNVALTRDQLSVARPVFFTKRQQRSDVGEGDASVSQPFEYLTHLHQLKREERSATKVHTPDRTISLS